MPKINVYLPDDLAAAVRDADLSVSPICQRALADAVRAVASVREIANVLREYETGDQRLQGVAARVVPRMTPHLESVLRHAAQHAGGPAKVTEADLLVSLLDQPENLGIQILASLDVDLAAVRASVAPSTRRARRAPARSAPADLRTIVAELSAAGRVVLAGAVEATLYLSSDVLGCTHLLLGLTDAEEPDGPLHVAQVTHDDVRGATRIASSAAAVGRRDHWSGLESLDGERLTTIDRRLEALEQRLAEGGL